MPEIVWKAGAEQDLLTIFERLEDWREGSGKQLLIELDNTLGNLRRHPYGSDIRGAGETPCGGKQRIGALLHGGSTRNYRPCIGVLEAGPRDNPAEDSPHVGLGLAFQLFAPLARLLLSGEASCFAAYFSPRCR